MKGGPTTLKSKSSLNPMPTPFHHPLPLPRCLHPLPLVLSASPVLPSLMTTLVTISHPTVIVLTSPTPTSLSRRPMTKLWPARTPPSGSPPVTTKCGLGSTWMCTTSYLDLRDGRSSEASGFFASNEARMAVFRSTRLASSLKGSHKSKVLTSTKLSLL